MGVFIWHCYVSRFSSWLFSEIDLFEDPLEAEGPVQMAVDEVLLGLVKRPLLRHYYWKGAWVSFGYAQKWVEIRQAFPTRDLVRRWSGGGAVDHVQDWTFSLIIPAIDPFRRLSASMSYGEIHVQLKLALSHFFDGVRVAVQEKKHPGAQCFSSPRRNDLCRHGRKVAGGAQRRSLAGILHQGSIQHLRLPDSFSSIFASHLAKKTDLFTVPKFLRKEVLRVATERYETEEWLKRR